MTIVFNLTRNDSVTPSGGLLAGMNSLMTACILLFVIDDKDPTGRDGRGNHRVVLLPFAGRSSVPEGTGSAYPVAMTTAGIRPHLDDDGRACRARHTAPHP